MGAPTHNLRGFLGVPQEMDVDGNGLISRQEFEDTMMDERSLLRAAVGGRGVGFLGVLAEAW